jgi:hypothetical protein
MPGSECPWSNPLTHFRSTHISNPHRQLYSSLDSYLNRHAHTNAFEYSYRDPHSYDLTDNNSHPHTHARRA